MEVILESDLKTLVEARRVIGYHNFLGQNHIFYNIVCYTMIHLDVAQYCFMVSVTRWLFMWPESTMWLLPLASQYLLMVLYIVQALITMVLMDTC